MEFTNIISLVPENEHFDASAINEGVWLSVAHLNAVENALATNKLANEQLTKVKDELTTANSSIEQLNASITDKQNTIDTQVTTIANLEARVTELGGQSSGTGSTIPPVNLDEVDDGGGKDGKVDYSSDSHPANQLADRLVSSNKRDEIFNLK